MFALITNISIWKSQNSTQSFILYKFKQGGPIFHEKISYKGLHIKKKKKEKKMTYEKSNVRNPADGS